MVRQSMLPWKWLAPTRSRITFAPGTLTGPPGTACSRQLQLSQTDSTADTLKHSQQQILPINVSGGAK